jgi:hypothetical protein
VNAKSDRVFEQAKIGQLQSLVMQQIQGRAHHEKNSGKETLVHRNHLEEMSSQMSSHRGADGQQTDTPEEQETASESSAISLGLEAVDLEDLEELAAKDGTTQQILQIFNQLNVSGEGVHAGWFSPAARKHQFKPCRRCQNAIVDL